MRMHALYNILLQCLHLPCFQQGLAKLRLLLLPSVPSKQIDAMEQLAGGWVTEAGVGKLEECFRLRSAWQLPWVEDGRRQNLHFRYPY